MPASRRSTSSSRPLTTWPKHSGGRSSPQRQIKPRVLAVPFGAGYGVVARDGINNLPETIQLIWSRLHPADRRTITDFFESTGGASPFLWTPPNDTIAKRWRYTDRSISYPAPHREALTATFAQVFGL